jgi:NAD-dependent dihydropyrimidine dehydrogenase PreA subunit
MSRVLLTFDAKQISQPTTAQVILELGVPLNIIRANVKPSRGEILIEIPEDRVEAVITAFQKRGVIVTVEKRLEVNENKCTHCGACFSLCPTGVIKFKEKYSIDFNEAECVACGLCIDACPTRALKLL